MGPKDPYRSPVLNSFKGLFWDNFEVFETLRLKKIQKLKNINLIQNTTFCEISAPRIKIYWINVCIFYKL
jgi:hypothetical protein